MTAAEEREKILDKLRKLNAMAESAAELGSEHEAQAFAAKVQELLTAYKLNRADIGGEAPKDEPINITYVSWRDLGLESRKVRVGWTERLGHFVAEAYYCDFVICGWGGHIGMLVGAETDRKVATYMYVTLGRFLQKLVEQEYAAAWKRCLAAGDVTLCRGFKAGFTYGFLTRLKERFDEEVRPKADVPLATTTAIVHVRRDSLAKVKEWQKDNMNLRPVRGTQLDDGSREGRARGKSAADAVDLQGKAFEKTGKSTLQIGSRS